MAINRGLIIILLCICYFLTSSCSMLNTVKWTQGADLFPYCPIDCIIKDKEIAFLYPAGDPCIEAINKKTAMVQIMKDSKQKSQNILLHSSTNKVYAQACRFFLLNEEWIVFRNPSKMVQDTTKEIPSIERYSYNGKFIEQIDLKSLTQLTSSKYLLIDSIVETDSCWVALLNTASTSYLAYFMKDFSLQHLIELPVYPAQNLFWFDNNLCFISHSDINNTDIWSYSSDTFRCSIIASVEKNIQQINYWKDRFYMVIRLSHDNQLCSTIDLENYIVLQNFNLETKVLMRPKKSQLWLFCFQTHPVKSYQIYSYSDTHQRTDFYDTIETSNSTFFSPLSIRLSKHEKLISLGLDKRVTVFDLLKITNQRLLSPVSLKTPVSLTYDDAMGILYYADDSYLYKQYKDRTMKFELFPMKRNEAILQLDWYQGNLIALSNQGALWEFNENQWDELISTNQLICSFFSIKDRIYLFNGIKNTVFVYDHKMQKSSEIVLNRSSTLCIDSIFWINQFFFILETEGQTSFIRFYDESGMYTGEINLSTLLMDGSERITINQIVVSPQNMVYLLDSISNRIYYLPLFDLVPLSSKKMA